MRVRVAVNLALLLSVVWMVWGFLAALARLAEGRSPTWAVTHAGGALIAVVILRWIKDGLDLT